MKESFFDTLTCNRMFSSSTKFIFFTFFKHTKHNVHISQLGEHVYFQSSPLSFGLYFLSHLGVLETYILVLNSLYLILKICNDLLMIFLCLVCKFLSTMRKQNIAAVPSVVFCFWLVTGKQQLIHPFPIDV